MIIASIYAIWRRASAGRWGLVLAFLAAGPAAHAADYYWVGGNGQWDDLTHWATTSGGSRTHTQVPQSTDDVHFDAHSFTASNQTVSIGATVTCHDMDWTGAVYTPAGGAAVTGMRLLGNGTVEVNGDLRLATGLGRQDANFRLLATSGGHELDLRAVPINGWLSFESEAGAWAFSSDVNLVQYAGTPSLLLMAGSVDFGNATVSCFGVRSTGNRVRDIYLNASTFNLLAPVNTWEVAGSNLTLEAGTSTLRMGTTPRSTANAYTFISTAQTYNTVEVAAGASATFSVAGSTFNTLTIKGNAALTSAATITGTLGVGAEAVLRAAGGQTLMLGSRAVLALGGSCAGLAHLQSSVPGQAAVLQRAGSWSSTTIAYAAVQDITFSGGGSVRATSSLNRGNTQNITFTALPTSDLYWVGGSGSWHDATHWASTSGGAPTGSGCLPTLATNVRFDANSFTAAGQVVTLDGSNAFCRDMDWTGANAPVFSQAATDLGQKQLGIGGSLTLAATMTISTKADLVFYGHEVSSLPSTVATAERTLLGNVYFRAPGSTYTLLDALTLAPGATSPNGRLYVEAGAFNTSNQAIKAQGFTSGYAATGSVFTTGSSAGGPVSAAPVSVKLGSSLLTLTPASGTSDVGVRTTYTWDVAPGVTLDAGTSTISISSNSTRNQPAFFRAGLGLVYNIVAFTDPASGSLPTVVSGGGAIATFNQLRFAGSANVSASNTFRQQLSMAAGRIYNFYNSSQLFDANAQLVAGGDCSGYVTINGGTGTARVTFSKPAGGTANQPVAYAALRNVTFTGGSQWTANQCFDNGGNSGISFTNPPVPRTLYWVGNGGNWSDPAHWALSSGGAAGICVPNQLDYVVFDSKSFTLANQTVTQDAVLASCRSLSWAAVTNAPTFGGAAANRLAIYGSLTWSPTMNQQWQGETMLLGNGTLTSAGQSFGGALTINAPDATINLADALLQPRTGGNGLTLTAGTLLTNNQPLQLRSLASAPLDGATTPPSRTLLLGSSTVEITSGAWALSQPSSLTFDAGTSTILLSTGAAFNGNGFAYNIVQTGAGATHTVGGSGSTIASLQLAGVNYVTGSNTITQQLSLAPGSTYQFGAGTTTTFTADATVQANGTGAKVITLQSTVNGQPFSWSKPSGTVCASYIYLRDSQAQGGAYFEAGQNANNQGNTSGWSFASLPQAAYASQQVCPQLGAHPLRFTFAGLDRLSQQPTTLAAAQFPLTVVLRNLTAGTTETLTIPSATYDYLVPNSTATTQYQVLSVATNSTSCTPLANMGPFPVVTDAPLDGPAGQWTGHGTTASWLDCQNWASGTVPTPTTDVTVGPATVAPIIDAPGATVGTLHLVPGGQLTLGSAAELAVSGDWLNTGGTATVAASSQVAFVGNSPQVVANGEFGRVVINNGAGLTLQSDATSATSLTLTVGIINTGSFKWVHFSSAGSSLSTSGSSYVAGTLRRYVAPGSTDTYAFPVGTSTQYARFDLVSNNLVGTRYLDASFSSSPEPTTELSCNETAPSQLRYVELYTTGRWLLLPDAQPTGGTYTARAYLGPFNNLVDNYFGLLKRPETSTTAADWSVGGGTLSPTDGDGRRVADGYALRSGLSSFSQFALARAEQVAPLPVTLVSLRAVAQKAGTLLSWVVAQEVGISTYEVERSLDGLAFQRVGQVAAKEVATATYSYLDASLGQPLGGQPVYYRLRVLESTKPATYSPTVVVQNLAAATLMVWPTVFSSELHLDGTNLGEDMQRVELLDTQGRVVLAQQLPAGSRLLTLNGQGLAAGLYLLRVTTATHRYQERLVHH
ncbi:T9SS type A sorting domain-containing protein [Hymenobacter sp. BT559]|uniref:T9SS type A sorting domain-containing protein n=1 Tax=Hymenobacter sp. BT559 TaxID=2795729 RepID=UPI0018ED89D8|nr:T9SS type A sorting domain-containing protein [Hymenobacter sp. BT559]MBJ6144510.1 T9SS type A sorting domain-containing protein [Hymenobacter sp. BT559]